MARDFAYACFLLVGLFSIVERSISTWPMNDESRLVLGLLLVVPMLVLALMGLLAGSILTLLRARHDKRLVALGVLYAFYGAMATANALPDLLSQGLGWLCGLLGTGVGLWWFVRGRWWEEDQRLMGEETEGGA